MAIVSVPFNQEDLNQGDKVRFKSGRKYRGFFHCRTFRTKSSASGKDGCRGGWNRAGTTERAGELLVIRKLWRSVIWTTWGNPEHFTTTYFLQTLGGATYLAGDGGIRDQDADYFTNTGRIDDVLNVPGHRRGIMEIESALVAHALVAEEAVFGERDGTTGESISAFVVLRHARPVGVEAKQIGKELREWIRQRKRPN